MCFVVAGVLEMENEQDRNAIKKAKVLYNSCMNESKALFILSEKNGVLLKGGKKTNIQFVLLELLVVGLSSSARMFAGFTSYILDFKAIFNAI